MTRFLLAAIVLAGCGDSARPTTPVEIAPVVPSASAVADASAPIEASTLATPSTTHATANALIARTCGPTDGPATTMIITDELLTCDDWGRAHKRAYVSIETWGTLGIAEHTTIDLPIRSGGDVSTCTANGACERITRGSLAIDHVDVSGDTFEGTLDITPKTGARRHVVVHAIRCELHMMCG